MRSFAVAGVAGLFLATAAQAASSGSRVEALVGWDKNEVSTIGGDLGWDGVVYGLGFGYDFGVGSAVSLGVDLEASDSSSKVRANGGGITAQVSTGRDLYAGGRVSLAVSPSANLYLKAGYTNARLTGRVQSSSGSSVTYNGNFDGVRGGGGVQFMLTEKLYVGGEYRYSNYEADYSRHQVVGTLGFRF